MRNLRVNSLRDDSDHPPKRRSHSHRRYEDSSRNLAAVRKDDETGPDDRCEQEGVDVSPLRPGPAKRSRAVRRALLKLGQRDDVLAEVVVVSSSLALLEEDGHALRHVDPKILVEIRDDRGHSG